MIERPQTFVDEMVNGVGSTLATAAEIVTGLARESETIKEFKRRAYGEVFNRRIH